MLSFRAASLDDVDAIVALVERAYRGDASRAGWTTEADLLDGQRTDPSEVRDLVTSTRTEILLAEDGGRMVGTAALTDEGDAIYFGMFAVEPTLQGAGLGRAMIAESEKRTVARGHSRMRLTVIAQRQELIAWYLRQGYETTGEIAPFPYGNPRFGQPKRDDLYFVVLEKRLDEG